MYQTLLLDAAVKGDAPSITKILATPGFTPQNACFGALTIAAEKREVQAVRLMLEHFPLLMDWQYNLVTDRAIEQGNIAVLLAVLNNPRATPGQKAARFDELRTRRYCSRFPRATYTLKSNRNLDGGTNVR